METIREYLNNIFANLPATDDVFRAKQELLAMMEDKYNELIAEGKTENEAVGTIISEFGNLDEISDLLGIDKAQADGNEICADSFDAGSRRFVSLEEAKDYISNSVFCKYVLGIGVAFCIISVIGPIMGSGIEELFAIGVISRVAIAIGIIFLFLSIALGVGLIIISSARNKEWKFLKNELCYIDEETESFVRNESETASVSKGMVLATGIVLCSLCFLPTAVIGIIFENEFMSGAVGPSLLFIMVGLGVLLIIVSSARSSACGVLLKLNSVKVAGKFEGEDDDETGIHGTVYADTPRRSGDISDSIAGAGEDPCVSKLKAKELRPVYRDDLREVNPLIETVLGNYWTIVLIVFFVGGFVFGAWGWIWIIWLIAPIVRSYLKKLV